MPLAVQQTSSKRTGQNPCRSSINAAGYRPHRKGAVMKKAKKKAKRDIEKTYTTKQMVAKLRRLADCLEQGGRFRIQIAGERVLVPADAVFNFDGRLGILLGSLLSGVVGYIVLDRTLPKAE